MWKEAAREGVEEVNLFFEECRAVWLGSMSGFIVRTTSKILAHTISFFLADLLTPQLSN